MKAKLLVSTAFLAASVSLSAQKNATITVHADQGKEIIPKESALRNWTAFLYFQKGATLLYAGQENQNETRPDLFNKDVINLDGSRDISDMLRQLYQIKKLPVVAKSSYRLSADEGLGAAIGEHKEIQE